MLVQILPESTRLHVGNTAVVLSLRVRAQSRKRPAGGFTGVDSMRSKSRHVYLEKAGHPVEQRRRRKENSPILHRKERPRHDVERSEVETRYGKEEKN